MLARLRDAEKSRPRAARFSGPRPGLELDAFCGTDGGAMSAVASLMPRRIYMRVAMPNATPAALAPLTFSARARTCLGALAVLAMLVPTASCKRKDPEKCDQGTKVSRQALESEDFALAKQWREYAYKHCEDTMSLQQLDQAIVNKEAEVAKRKADEAQKQADRSQLLGLFMRWASENRASPGNASKAFRCDPPAPGPDGQPPKEDSKERWCSATRAVDTRYSFIVRYWEAEPESVRFSTRPASPASCADLGEHAVVRTWDVPAPGGQMVKRTLCNLTSGPLAGMQAVVSAAVADVHVFTAKYAARDPRVTR
jgi:hypothetical protein